MALCSLRCLFASATVVGMLVVLYPIVIRVPDGINAKDKDVVRMTKVLRPVFQLIISTAELFGYNDMQVFRKIITLRGRPNDPQVPDGMKVYNLAIAGVRTRVYERTDAAVNPRPAVVFYHGGGWVFGAPEFYDEVMFKVLKDLDVVIISVAYRLAPEYPYPIPLQDCEMVTSHVLQNPDKFGVDPLRIAIGGDSAGGNLAAAVALKLRNNPNIITTPKLQLLLYPALQAFDFNTPAYTIAEHEIILYRTKMLEFWLYYIKGNLEYLPVLLANKHTSPAAKRSKAGTYTRVSNLPPKLIPEGYTATDMDSGNEAVWKALGDYVTNPYICPLMADDLSNLPKTYLVTVGFDVLRDDGFFYSKRLKESGNDVEHIHYPDTTHGTFSYPGFFMGEQMQNNLITYLKDNL